MHVIATAGHVDHGKSTLVRALTGQNPDRLGEERRRGLSIELGYCWTSLPDVGDVAFVDVPGHERFVSTMLAGVGPVPAVLFVVAADDPWMPQATEHLAALDAFGVSHGVVAVTRSDLADPSRATAEARQRLHATTLRGAPVIAVSARSGEGMPALRSAVAAMVSSLPDPPDDGAVRLWVDRRFHISGAGTVVTGTLPTGTICVGDELMHGDATVRVRGLESLGRPAQEVRGVSRVALRLGGTAPGDIRRGSPLVQRDAWHSTRLIDVRLSGRGTPPEQPQLHIGSASIAVHCRPLGADLCRLALDHPLPLHVGDRAVIRDPGSRVIWGVVVVDPDPPALTRRGAARRRAAELAATTGAPDLSDELRRRTVARRSELRRLGVGSNAVDGLAVSVHDWLVDPHELPQLRMQLRKLADERRVSHPLDASLPVAAAARTLGLPSPELVSLLVSGSLAVVDGRVVDSDVGLPPQVLTAVRRLTDDLATSPFSAPDSERLIELGLDRSAIAAATRAGQVLRLSDTVVLLPGADRAAARLLAELPQPFTTSQARVRLDTSRRVVLPLLEHLDALRLTRRLADDRREVIQGTERGTPHGGDDSGDAGERPTP